MTSKLLTVDEVADYLGIPKTTLYQWRYRGDGPAAFRVGRHLRYRSQDVDEYVAEQIEVTRSRRSA